MKWTGNWAGPGRVAGHSWVGRGQHSQAPGRVGGIVFAGDLPDLMGPRTRGWASGGSSPRIVVSGEGEQLGVWKGSLL